MEASGHARWFERLLRDLQFELWIGDAAEIRTKRVRKQKTDRQDAQLLLQLMMEDRFPRIWVPDAENRDLRQLLWHRHRLVQRHLDSIAYGRIKWSEMDRMCLIGVKLATLVATRFSCLIVLELRNQLEDGATRRASSIHCCSVNNSSGTKVQSESDTAAKRSSA